MKYRMNIRQLKHFLALAEHGSYARASESVHLSQPALSRSIQQLEQYLGAPLFERGRMGAMLSAYGKVSLPHIRGIVAAEEALKQSIQCIDGLESGELRIGGGPFPSFGLLDKVSAKFIDRYPGISLYLCTNNWHDLHQSLLNREIELFVADTKELVNDPMLKVINLPSLPGVFFCRHGHPLMQQAQIEWQDLLAYPIALPRLPKYFELYLNALSQPHGGLRRRIECDNIAMLWSFVAGSNAISIAPELMLQEKFAEGSMQRLPVTGLGEMQTNFGVVHRSTEQLSPAAAAYLAFILAEVEPLTADSAGE